MLNILSIEGGKGMAMGLQPYWYSVRFFAIEK